jgi:hypothetical protein
MRLHRGVARSACNPRPHEHHVEYQHAHQQGSKSAQLHRDGNVAILAGSPIRFRRVRHALEPELFQSAETRDVDHSGRASDSEAHQQTRVLSVEPFRLSARARSRNIGCSTKKNEASASIPIHRMLSGKRSA